MEPDYQETGEHVTWSEAKAWLKTWGADDEQEPPKVIGKFIASGSG